MSPQALRKKNVEIEGARQMSPQAHIFAMQGKRRIESEKRGMKNEK